MSMYIKGLDGTPTRDLQSLLPDTIHPQNLPVAEREAQDVYECEIVQPAVEWSQQRGAEIRDTEARPIRITYAVEDRAIEDVRALAWERVKSDRSALREQGVTASLAAGEIPVQTRSVEDQINVLAIVIAGLIRHITSDPTPVPFTDADNTEHELPPIDAVTMGMGVYGAVNGLHRQSQDMRDAILAAQTVAEIVAATEWP